MKIEKNFTTGVLSGICGILVLLVITGSTTPEPINNSMVSGDIGKYHPMTTTVKGITETVYKYSVDTRTGEWIFKGTD